MEEVQARANILVGDQTVAANLRTTLTRSQDDLDQTGEQTSTWGGMTLLQMEGWQALARSGVSVGGHLVPSSALWVLLDALMAVKDAELSVEAKTNTRQSTVFFSLHENISWIAEYVTVPP